MVQDSRIIDLRKSYLPGDPNAFPTKLPNTGGGEGDDRADADGGRFPIMPYDGYNFMPTPHGYSSFFGTTATLGVDNLNGNVDDVFIIQKVDFVNLAVALKDDGIWTKDLGSGGAWTQVVVLAVPAVGTHKNWSKCIIDQDLYVYRQGEASYWIAGASNSYVFTAVVPSSLNMVNQLGIFKAGGRLGFWDSLNSIAWSAFENKADFDDSLETLSGKAIFQDIVGRIVVVLQHGDGFVIYCTKAIVNVTRNVESPMLFLGDPVFNNNGIAYRDQVVMSDPDTTHFVLSTTGFCEVTQGKSTYSVPDISRYLKEQHDPMVLKLLNGKFLFFCYTDPEYNTGRLNYNYVEGSYKAPQISEWAAAKQAIDDAKNPASTSGVSAQDKANNAVAIANKKFDQVYLNTNFNYSNYQQGTSGQVPIWQDNLVSCIPLADLAVFKTYADTARSEQYFYDTGFSNGTFPLIDGTIGFFIPTKIPDLASAFTTSLHTEPNQKNFFSKQDAIFYYEGLFYSAWLQAVEEKIKAMEAQLDIVAYTSELEFTGPAITIISPTHDIGTPVVMPTFYSEKNKYYGTANKSGWLQRSLTQGQQITVKEHRKATDDIVTVVPWLWDIALVNPACASLYISSFTSYAHIMASLGAIATFLNCQVGAPRIHSVQSITEVPGIFGGTARRVQIVFVDQFALQTTANFTPYDSPTDASHPLTADYVLEVGKEVYKHTTSVIQTFSNVSNEPINYDTCTFKELGYTSIIGHGHYTSFGGFVQDNATVEAPDYVDICLSNPAPTKKPFFGGGGVASGGTSDNPYTNASALGYTPGNGGPFYGQGSVNINGVNYSYPIGDYIDSASVPSVLAPSILLQPGSIEPIYPTFVGAFVFDIHLKKWGKLKLDFKNLLDIFPVNTTAGDGIFAYENFLPKAGARIAAGNFPIFDEYPIDSEIVFGKVGYYRKGFTDLEEVIFQHRNYRTGTLQIEPSIDSRSIDNSNVQIRPYSDAALIREGLSASARWYNIVFKKAFDLTHLEVKTVRRGRR